MIIGFTGTLKGMSRNQKDKVKWLLDTVFPGQRYHHGFAKGADREFEEMIVGPEPTRGVLAYAGVRRHPSNGRPLERDKEIVAAVDILIATPRSNKEVLRSGTWATIRYAYAKGIPVIIVPRGR